MRDVVTEQTLFADISFPIAATKMSGTGNDFLIIDNRQHAILQPQQAEFARLVCRRKVAAGADGLILIEPSATADFRWQFYNADGSRAEMCGNGARCAARFAHQKGIAGARMCFETIAGVIEAEMRGDLVKIRLTPPESIVHRQTVVLDGKERIISSINTGVPHVVCFVDAIDSVPVETWGRQIRFHELFQPAGTNVNFVGLLADGGLKVRTYERGVEGETLACGTGAVASALMAAMEHQVSGPIQVTTSGGEQLIVHFCLDENALPGEVFLEGPARCIYEAQLDSEILL